MPQHGDDRKHRFSNLSLLLSAGGMYGQGLPLLDLQAIVNHSHDYQLPSQIQQLPIAGLERGKATESLQQTITILKSSKYLQYSF